MAATRIVVAFDWTGAVVRARTKAGLKHEALAALMGISSQQLSQQLASQGHLSLPRLLSIATTEDGRAFWRFFWPEVAEYVGIEDRDALACQLRQFTERFQRLIDKVQVRMAQAQLDEEERRRA